MIRNIISLFISLISKYIQLDKCTNQKNSNENPYLGVSYIFVKVNVSNEMNV
jgi:hypothetical protein